MTTRNALKQYFLTGKKPTQGQFAELIDSLLHKTEDQLTIAMIQGLSLALSGKASTAQITDILTKLDSNGSNTLIEAVVSIVGDQVELMGTSWKNSGSTFLISASLTYTIPAPDGTGLLRIDRIIGKNNGTTQYLVGIAAQNAIAPNLPDNTVLITDIYSSITGTTTQPGTAGTNYVKQVGFSNLRGGLQWLAGSYMQFDAGNANDQYMWWVNPADPLRLLRLVHLNGQSPIWEDIITINFATKEVVFFGNVIGAGASAFAELTGDPGDNALLAAALLAKASTVYVDGQIATEVAARNNAIAAETNARVASEGDKVALTTTAKGSLVAAINEVNAKPSGGGFEIGLACSDEVTALSSGVAKITFRMPYTTTITSVSASLGTAPTGSSLVIDINEGGVSILSTKLSIDATEKTSVTAATPYVLSDAVLAADAEITIDIDQVGAVIAGTGLKVFITGTKN